MTNDLLHQEAQSVQPVQEIPPTPPSQPVIVDASSPPPLIIQTQPQQQSEQQEPQQLQQIVETNETALPESQLSPEPINETPKLVPGQLAVCAHCGYLSEDFNRCLRCKRKFPDDVKSISTTINTAAIKKAETLRAVQQIQEKKHINITLKSNGNVKLPSGVNVNVAITQVNTKRRPVKQKTVEQEPDIVTLSSDDEEVPPLVRSTNQNADELAKRLQNSQVTLSAVRKEPSLNDIMDKKEVTILPIGMYFKIYISGYVS